MLDVVKDTAEAMVPTSALIAAEIEDHAQQLAEWLLDCCDQMSEPDGRTVRGRTIDCLSPATTNKAAERPLRRWLAAIREHTQAVGVGWIRGEIEGDVRFGIAQLGKTWCVVEGGRGTAAELRGPLLAAASEAIVRQAKDGGKSPASAESLCRDLNSDCDQYLQSPVAQPPDWLDQT